MGDAYGDKALQSACDKIRNTEPGKGEEGKGRNVVLNLEAYSLGGLVACGRLEQFEVERALMNAALDAGLERVEAEKTIASGIKAGMRRPRMVTDTALETSSKATPVPPIEKNIWEPTEAEDPPEQWVDQVHTVLAWAHGNLFENKSAMEYLKQRGIGWQTASKFVLGWNPGEGGRDIYRDPKEWGLPKREKKMWLPRGIVIPNFSNGRVSRLRFRRPKEHGDPRYVVLSGSSRQCLAVENGTARAAIVVESELDAMLLEQEVGDWCTIVGLGSAGARPDKRTHELLRSHEAIFVCLDYDTAGAAEYQWWKKHYRQAQRLVTPEGKDPGEAQKTIDVRAWIHVALYRAKLTHLDRY